MSAWHGVLADDEKLSRCKISTDTVHNTLKTHTKYAHIIRGRPTLKDVERFRNGSVRKPYERSLHERTFMSEPFIEKHAISTTSQGNELVSGQNAGQQCVTMSLCSLIYSNTQGISSANDLIQIMDIGNQLYSSLS